MAQTTVRTVAQILQTLSENPKDLWADDCEVLYDRAFVACGGKTTTTAPTGSTAAPTDNSEAVAAR
ncbi:hypothetical protein [Streptomyces sp. NPDC058084]|uniref:hypothetical protein n=1 Tax=Streptomyces sp. NPDC058084 TaxID=3346333 RepID=UPI0036E71EB5